MNHQIWLEDNVSHASWYPGTKGTFEAAARARLHARRRRGRADARRRRYQIKEIEEQLDVVLFTRTSRIQLTPAGKVLFDAAGVGHPCSSQSPAQARAHDTVRLSLERALCHALVSCALARVPRAIPDWN